MPENDRRDPKNNRHAERDDFWDIDRLIPERRDHPPVRRNRPTPTAVEIEVPASHTRDGKDTVSASSMTVQPASIPTSKPISRPSEAVHYIPPHTAEEEKEEAPLADYRPEGVLIHRVQVHAWASGFHYFDQFAKDAAEYATRPAPAEARRESFFSYFPQYVQMNRRQTDWYLWWREQVRNGIYPETDYAYILLYLFELINLDAEEAEIARRYGRSMASVWMAYRRVYPQLNHYMCEWLCDYCLIHELPAPLDILSPALDDIIVESRLKEFYLVSIIQPEENRPDEPGESNPLRERRGLVTARILMRHCCQYDYRKSKFAQGEHKALFDRIIPAAVAAMLPLLLGSSDQPPALTMQDSTVTRDAFTGALCSYGFKRKITVSYTSFSRSHDLRFLIGDMVKHVENRLRTWIGVRSKLSTMSLPIPLRDALDAYLEPLAPRRVPPVTKKKEPVRPEYEALYDLPDKPLSLADAAAIEASSWETTRILTEAFGGEEEAPVPHAPEKVPVFAAPPAETPAETPAESVAESAAESAAANASLSPLAAALGDLLPFLRAALDGDRDAERAYASSVHKMPDAIADEINAITAETEIFDMVLEDAGDGCYTVIDDYREILQSI